jgi:hypothetical protein
VAPAMGEIAVGEINRRRPDPRWESRRSCSRKAFVGVTCAYRVLISRLPALYMTPWVFSACSSSQSSRIRSKSVRTPYSLGEPGRS